VISLADSSRWRGEVTGGQWFCAGCKRCRERFSIAGDCIRADSVFTPCTPPARRRTRCVVARVPTPDAERTLAGGPPHPENARPTVAARRPPPLRHAASGTDWFPRHVMHVQVSGRIADSREVGHVVAASTPGRRRGFRGQLIRAVGGIRHRGSRGLLQPPDLVTRAEPDRSPVRRSPHAHAMAVRPFENRNRLVRLASHQEQLAGLIGRKGQTDPLFLQPIQEIARPLDLQPRLLGRHSVGFEFVGGRIDIVHILPSRP